MSFVTFDLLIPASLWLALAGLGGALLAWYALRRPSVIRPWRWTFTITLMAGALALVLVILLNPTWQRKVDPPPGKPILTILVDSSASMGTADANGATRYVAAVNTAKQVAERQGDKFEVRIRHFAAAPGSTDLAQLSTAGPTGQSTDLSTALLSSLDEQRPQGQAVLLLSDGIDNVSGGTGSILAATRVARAGATPIYAKTLGGSAKEQDLALELRSAQDLAIVNQKVFVTARITHKGVGSVKVTALLLRDGVEVARREAELTAVSASSVHFAIGQEKAGIYSYEVRVEPLVGERTQANNSASYLLRVVDEPIRVLALEGKPYWDSKFFVRTLASDPAIALDSIVRLTDNRYMRRTLSGRNAEGETAPVSATTRPGVDRLETWKIVPDVSQVLEDSQGLKAYQVVVLGRDAGVFLTDAAMQTVATWISRDGGSLLCYRGAPEAQINSRLGKLLPVRWSPARETHFRMSLTDQGRDMQWLGGEGTGLSRLAQMPALATEARIEQPKPLAVVLATAASAGGEQTPAAVYQPYGSGRVVVIEGAGMWRWAFLPPQYRDHEQVYSALWPSLLRWLTSGGGLLPGQQMTLRADKVRFGTVEPVTATLLARQEVTQRDLPAVELVTADSPNTAPKSFVPTAIGDEPGVFRVSFGKLPPGRYQIRLAQATEDDASARAAFDVREFGQELLDLEARPDLMARIASDSGGVELSQGDTGDEIATRFDDHFNHTHPPRIERSPAWDRWWVIAAVVTLWGTCWMIRRSGGLV